MHFAVLTLFPEMFAALRVGGIIGRCIERKQVSVDTIDPRAFATDRHRTVDDRPYGGGCGMVMKPEPLVAAIRHTKQRHPENRIVLLTPQGRLLNQGVVRDLVKYEGLTLVCGRYEGIDDRVRQRWVDEEVSIGDYVLTGGELPAMVVIDAVARMIPGALGNAGSAEDESFTTGLLEYPHYTRPRSFEGTEVPEVLLSGDHGRIEQWRRRASLIKTLVKRPDLLRNTSLSVEDTTFLEGLYQDLEMILSKGPKSS